MEGSKRSWLGAAMHNKLVALVLAMTVLVPLAATPADSGMHGLAALAFEGFAVALLALLMWRSRWNFSGEQVRTFLRTGANLPVLCLVGLAAVSAALAPNKVFAGQELLRLGAGALLYFVVGYQFRRSEHLSKLIDTLLFVAVAGAFLGFSVFGAGAKEFAIGGFGDHQLFGSFLMMLLPICGVVAITDKSPNRQLAGQVATVLVSACLLLAHSRSAWVGGAASLAVLGGLALYANQRAQANKPASMGWNARKHELVLPLMLVVVALGFFALIAPQSSGLLNRVSSLGKFSTDASFKARQPMQAGAKQMMLEHPFTGIGLGQYTLKQNAYTHTGSASLVAMKMAPSLSEQAHNVYLQMGAELGIPGVALLAAVLVSFWVMGIKRVGNMEPGLRRSLLMGSLAASVAFAIDGLNSPSWQLPQVSMFLWLILGVGLSCLRPHSKRIEEEERETILPVRVLRPAMSLAALGIGVALLPTIVASAADGYVTPVSAAITPKPASLRGGRAQIFTLTVTFSDGSKSDVSVLPGTTFTKVGGAGFLTGPNNRSYQSRLRENDQLDVTGAFTQSGVTVSDTSHVTVTP